MHIGVGEFEGKELLDPVGEQVSTRTLTIKEEIFTIIGTRILDATVIDINDANGVFGIESLSRGAKNCVFVNDDQVQTNLINENLGIVGRSSENMTVTTAAEEFLKTAPAENYDVLFFEIRDQKELPLIEDVLSKQKESGMTVVIYPHREEFEVPNTPDFEVIETREFEDRRIAVYLRNQQS